MVKICIIGSGNVAHHLYRAFSNTEARVVQIYSRSQSRGIPREILIDDLADLENADLYIMAVSDNAVAEVSGQLPFSGRLVAHTSGSMPIDSIDAKNRRGVFYPLQTFSKNKEVDFQKVPLCIEAENELDLTILGKVASALSTKVVMLDSAQRKALHVSAVFVSNFTNRMYGIAEEICLENNVDFDLLKPLILETAAKVQTLDPKTSQTGPAKRNDSATIDMHLELLSGTKKEIYEIMTQSIQNG